MKLSIIILNYKTKGLLQQSLRNIKKEHLPFDHEVIVVDNNSRDGSVEMIREQFPEVTLIVSPKNVGFSAGNNLGIAVAKGEYLLILNTDVAFFGNAVAAMSKYLDNHPHVGIAVPRLLNPDGSAQESTYLFPSFWVAALRRTPLGKLPGARGKLRQYAMSDWDRMDMRSIGWALGACLMIRASDMKDVGGFDEQYFLYVEDTDLCRRFWAAGHEVHFVPTAEMVHFHKRESAKRAGVSGLFSYPTRVHIRSWLIYFKKFKGQPKPKHSL